MEIKKVKIDAIKINPNNPRIIKDDKFKKLVNSIKELPQMLEIRPIVVNSDMVILGGNMRYKACVEAKLKEVYILVANNLTEEQQKEFLIKDNVSGGEWDWEILSNDWDTDKLEEWGVDLKIKFNDDEDEDELPEEKTYIERFRFEVSCKTEKDKNILMSELMGRGISCTDDY